MATTPGSNNSAEFQSSAMDLDSEDRDDMEMSGDPPPDDDVMIDEAAATPGETMPSRDEDGNVQMAGASYEAAQREASPAPESTTALQDEDGNIPMAGAPPYETPPKRRTAGALKSSAITGLAPLVPKSERKRKAVMPPDDASSEMLRKKESPASRLVITLGATVYRDLCSKVVPGPSDKPQEEQDSSTLSVDEKEPSAQAGDPEAHIADPSASETPTQATNQEEHASSSSAPEETQPRVTAAEAGGNQVLAESFAWALTHPLATHVLFPNSPLHGRSFPCKGDADCLHFASLSTPVPPPAMKDDASPKQKLPGSDIAGSGIAGVSLSDEQSAVGGSRAYGMPEEVSKSFSDGIYSPEGSAVSEERDAGEESAGESASTKGERESTRTMTPSESLVNTQQPQPSSPCGPGAYLCSPPPSPKKTSRATKTSLVVSAPAPAPSTEPANSDQQAREHVRHNITMPKSISPRSGNRRSRSRSVGSRSSGRDWSSWFIAMFAALFMVAQFAVIILGICFGPAIASSLCTTSFGPTHPFCLSNPLYGRGPVSSAVVLNHVPQVISYASSGQDTPDDSAKVQMEAIARQVVVEEAMKARKLAAAEAEAAHAAASPTLDCDLTLKYLEFTDSSMALHGAVKVMQLASEAVMASYKRWLPLYEGAAWFPRGEMTDRKVESYSLLSQERDLISSAFKSLQRFSSRLSTFWIEFERQTSDLVLDIIQVEARIERKNIFAQLRAHWCVKAPWIVKTCAGPRSARRREVWLGLVDSMTNRLETARTNGAVALQALEQSTDTIVQLIDESTVSMPELSPNVVQNGGPWIWWSDKQYLRSNKTVGHTVETHTLNAYGTQRVALQQVQSTLKRVDSVLYVLKAMREQLDQDWNGAELNAAWKGRVANVILDLQETPKKLAAGPVAPGWDTLRAIELLSKVRRHNWTEPGKPEPCPYWGFSPNGRCWVERAGVES